MTQSGYIAVIGRPNVGKSTLINQILGQKIAITSRKPQTTRHTLLGIYTHDTVQMVFVDTPGIHHNAKKAMDRQMNRLAWQALDFVDVIVQVSEVDHWTEEDMRVCMGIATLPIKKIHVINKIDKCRDKMRLLSNLTRISEMADWQAIIPISAARRRNIDTLLSTLVPLMPMQSWIFPKDQITTASMRFMAAEILREKLFRYLHQEIPYALGVIIERYREDKGMVFIDAVIIVERDSHKGIVIGKGGKTLQAIGMAAREELEYILACKVMLRNFVKVKENWRDNDLILRSMQVDSGSN